MTEHIMSKQELVRALMNLGIELNYPKTRQERKELVNRGIALLEKYEERFKY